MNAERYSEITITSDVLQGQPRIVERRLSIGDVISTLKYGSFAEAEEDFKLTRKQIKQALAYCLNQQCLQDKPDLFCHNCRLRAAQEPLNLNECEEIEIAGQKYVKDNGDLFFGSLVEYIEEWSGKERWKQAADLMTKYKDKL